MITGKTKEHSFCRGGGIPRALKGARLHARYGEVDKVERCVGIARTVAARTIGVIVQGPLVEAARHALLYRAHKQRGKVDIREAWDMARGGMISEVEAQLNRAKASARKTGLPLKHFIRRRERFRLVRKAFDAGLHVMRRAAHEGHAHFVLGEIDSMKRVARSLKWSVRVFLTREEERRIANAACRKWAAQQRKAWHVSYQRPSGDEADVVVGTLKRCVKRTGSSPKALLGSEQVDGVMDTYSKRVAKRMAAQVFDEMKRRVFGRR